MPPVVIENPVINSPFEEPQRHFRFTDDGITNEIVDARRVSSYFIPIPQPKKRVKAAAGRSLWVPAVNNHGGFGQWAFLEITDPWDAKNAIRSFVRSDFPR